MIAKFVVQALVALCLLVLCESSTITINSNSALGMEYYLCNDTNMLESNTTIEVSSGIHYLPEGPMCRIENLTDLTIRGVDGSGEASLVICQGDHDIVLRGFFFFNVTNLLIENILFTNCGTTIPNDLPAGTNDTYVYFGPGHKAVFLFSHCTDVRLENLLLDRNFGFGVVGINLMGATELSHVTIQNTDNTRHLLCGGFVATDLSCSGSGAAFVYADDAITTAFGENATLNITNALFENNTNFIPPQHFLPLYLDVRSAFQTTPVILSGAAGLSISVGQLEYHVNVHIVDTSTINNDGDVGGMFLFWYNSIRNSIFNIENSVFINNRATGSGIGGGMLVSLPLFMDQLNSFPEYPDDIFDILYIRGTTFHSNIADQGGGIYIHITPQNVTDYRITIENTTFSKNIASAGSAIGAASIHSTLVTKATHILLEDVVAYGNTFQEAIFIGSDTIESSAVFVFFQINNLTITGKHDRGSKFYNNTPGVVLASGGNVFLRGHVTFEDNFGFNGGALSLYDNSLLFFHEGSRLQFTRNRALRYGGAIYSNTLATGIADACVIQIIGPSRIIGTSEINLLDIDVQFANNSAGEAGNSIHANPIYMCGYIPEASISATTVFENQNEVYSAIFNFSSTVDNGIRDLTSVPMRVCVCNQTEFSEVFCEEQIQIVSVNIIPGRTFTMYLVAIDQVGTPVTSLLYVEVEGSDNQLAPGQDLRELSGVFCTPVDFNLYGPEHTNPLVNLFTSPGGVPVTLNVTVESCPPGFQLEFIDSLQQCTCDEFIVNNIRTKCNETTYTVRRPENTWIGTHRDSDDSIEVVYVSTCPINYCDASISEVDLSIPDQLCENGRSGILCGKCEAPLSVIFGSAKCSDCSSLWLLTIPLYAIAGVLLVFFLFLLDLTVTKGTINGLVFYVNIVSVNANIFFRSTGQGFLFVFISILNLELGFPVCFYDGMNDAAKIGFQFVFPAYLMVLCGGIIYLSRWSRRMQKLLSSSGVQVLATLIYLSYAKILRTVIDTLSFATLKSDADKHLIWLFDGNVHYLEGAHIVLFLITAVVILAFVLPYTFSLALIVLIQRSSRFTPRLKPLIDAYLGPYKDKWRYWFGIRLILLLAMCVVYAALGTDDPGLALLLQLLLIVLFAILQAFVQPYKNFAIEFLDMSFTVNFIILALVMSHIVDDPQDEGAEKHVVRAMLSLAFLTFIGIITYHAMVQLRKIATFKQKTDEMYIEAMTKIKMGKFTPGSHKEQYPTTETTRATLEMVDTAHTSSTLYVNTNSTTRSSGASTVTTEVAMSEAESAPDDIRPHTATFSKLREPILDFS